MTFTDFAGSRSPAAVPDHSRLRGVEHTPTRPAGMPDPHPSKADVNHTHEGPRGALGQAEVVADQLGITTLVDLDDLVVTVTLTTSRRLRITGVARGHAAADNDAQGVLGVWRDGVLLSDRDFLQGLAGNGIAWGPVIITDTPTAGEHTYKLRVQQTVGGGGLNMQASATNPAFILVEDIGPA